MYVTRPVASVTEFETFLACMCMFCSFPHQRIISIVTLLRFWQFIKLGKKCLQYVQQFSSFRNRVRNTVSYLEKRIYILLALCDTQTLTLWPRDFTAQLSALPQIKVKLQFPHFGTLCSGSQEALLKAVENALSWPKWFCHLKKHPQPPHLPTLRQPSPQWFCKTCSVGRLKEEHQMRQAVVRGRLKGERVGGSGSLGQPK